MGIFLLSFEAVISKVECARPSNMGRKKILKVYIEKKKKIGELNLVAISESLLSLRLYGVFCHLGYMGSPEGRVGIL